MSFLKCSCTRAPTQSPVKSINSNTKDQQKLTDKIEPKLGSSLSSNAEKRMETSTNQYQLLAVIGRGCEGASTVSVARHKKRKDLVTIKITNLEDCPVDISYLKEEISMQRELRHENLLPLLGAYIHGMQLWTVAPLMAYGSCLDLIHAHFKEGLSEMAIAYIFRDVLQALEYLHKKEVIHRGIRAGHILISAQGEVKLTGFRHCCCLTHCGKRRKALFELPRHFVNNLLWASPELLEQNLCGYDTKTDIYSLGITACELANGEAPFCNIPSTQMLLEKLEDRTPILLDSTTVQNMQLDQEEIETESEAKASECGGAAAENTLMSTRSFSKHFHRFVESCLLRDTQLRPSALDLLQHPFIKMLRRRSSAVLPLPELLRPVNPISADALMQTNDTSQMDELSQQLEQVELEESWTF